MGLDYIFVSLPYDSVMVSRYDGESPWKESDEVNPEIVEWLDDYEPDWDWGFNYEVPYFRFKDPKVAVMFKLTWA